MGDAYRPLLQRDRTVVLVMLQAYAAADDEVVPEAVSHRYRSGGHGFHGAGPAGKRTDATWGAWLLELVDSQG
jgi:hypothetical protein